MKKMEAENESHPKEIEMQFQKEFKHIRKWAYSRGIYSEGDIKTQLIKLQEEVGELAKAVLIENRDELMDAIGDCVIVLTNLARLAEQHFCDQCIACRGLGGEINGQVDESGMRRWVACKYCGTMDIETCINKAFSEVKGRVGVMKNGTFVKHK
jgi:NTP pyrophosphatase (non-canonical NTP hydrolase)